MSLINVKEVKAQITYHQQQLDALATLLNMAEGIDSGKKKGHFTAADIEAATSRGPKKGTKRKRGAVSGAVLALLAKTGRPMASGEIKKALEASNLIEKGSTTIYSLLQQMDKRNAIKKNKGAEGIRFSLP